MTDAVNGVFFDLNNNGAKERTAWIDGGTQVGFLVLDRNGDGQITNGTELLGNITEQPNARRKNGFLALGVFDLNADGVIDKTDQVYDSLRVWVDLDHNGASEEEELLTLPSAGVQDISTHFSTHKTQDQFGNAYRYRAHFRMDRSTAEPKTRWATDVFFRSSQ